MIRYHYKIYTQQDVVYRSKHLFSHTYLVKLVIQH